MVNTETFICIGPHCWGKGFTEVEAVRKAKKNRVRIYEGPLGWRYILLKTSDPDAYVDGMGSVTRSSDSTMEEVKRVGKFEK